MIKFIKNNKKFGHIISFACILISALLQTYVIQAFIEPSNFLSGGFTGVSILVNKISSIFNADIPISITLLFLNIPLAILSYKAISKRFVFYSMLQVFFSSLFLNIFEFKPIFRDNDYILSTVFGGVILGASIVVALKGRASTGGTDFIALYVSNKKNKSIWNHVFVFNFILLCIFGFISDWSYAGYSILFQFISTKTVSTFHQRYIRVTLQITTSNSEAVIDEYIKNFRHGLSCVDAIGGYSKQKVTVIHTVVSSYEVAEIIEVLRAVDPYIIINMFKTEEFYGRFYQEPFE